MAVAITDILKGLDASPAPPMTEEERTAHKLSLLPDEDKYRQAWSWKMRGMPVPAIAKAFGVEPRTIYRWFSALKQAFRKTFDNETAADNLAGQLMHFEEIEQMCLFEVNQLGKDGKTVDPTTGVVTDNDNRQSELANKARFIKLALQARKEQVELLTKTGILPSSVDRMYKSLSEEGKIRTDEEQNRGSDAPIDRKQMISDLLNQMEKGRRLG
jgi:hypothetical protein